MALTRELKRLGKQSAIYGLGGILSRLIAVFLLPVYTVYLGRVGFGADLLEHLEPVQLGHYDVEQRDVVRFGAERVERRTAVGDGADGASPSSEEVRQDLAELHFVLGDEHLDLRLAHVPSPRSPARGRTMRKTLPSPGVLSTSIRPPCSAMIA